MQINHVVSETNRFDPVKVPVNDALVGEASSTRCLTESLVCL